MAGTTMTTVSIADDGAWHSVLAATPTSCTLQNLGSHDLMVRIGGSVSTGDAITAAHDILRPGEHRALTINAADAVIAAVIPGQGPGLINVRA